MWLFLTARLRQWAIFAIAVPLATALVHLVRRRLETRRGSTRLTRTLRRVEDLGQRRSKRRPGRRRRR